MDLAAFKKHLHGEMQDIILTSLPRYYEHLQTTEDFEELRKALTWMTTTVGATADTKVDAYSNLPVFQFNFTGGSVTATPMPMADVVELDPNGRTTPAAGSPDEPQALATLDFMASPSIFMQAAGRVALNRDVAFDDADIEDDTDET